jgi:uridylate kinase
MIKATRVDGIYDSDPEKNPDAKLFEEISYDEVLEKNLKVMDLTAIVLAKENSLKIKVVNLSKKNAVLNAVS